ncbi:MAG: hypothetical protein RBR65_04165 [Aliarcobacter sp.]|jgi:hypothetical protein|nr:hypothetical protein [Aliarcobacter sp.]
MIFIGLFLFIAFIVIALNLHNQSNLDEIEKYLQNNNCQEITYSMGSYKALCDEYLIEIENSFTVDINKNSKSINYTNIKDLQIEKLNIIVNNDLKMKFKNQENLDLFFKNLEKKLNK